MLNGKKKIYHPVKYHLQFHVLDLSQNMCLLHCTRIIRTVLYYYRCINFSFYTWVTCTTNSHHTFDIFPAKPSMVLTEKITCYINYSTSKQPCLSWSKQAETLILSMGATVSVLLVHSAQAVWLHTRPITAFSHSQKDLSHHVIKLDVLKLVKLLLLSDVPVSH